MKRTAYLTERGAKIVIKINHKSIYVIMELSTLSQISTLNENKTLEKIDELKQHLENCLQTQGFILKIYQELAEKVNEINDGERLILSKESLDIETLQGKYNKTAEIEENLLQILNQYQDFLLQDSLDKFNSLIQLLEKNRKTYKEQEILLQIIEYFTSHVDRKKDKLEHLINLIEEYGIEYPKIIIKLQDLVCSCTELKMDREFQELPQKFVDVVLLASEKIRFQEFIKDAPEWDREEQIKKNQKVINLLREWRSEEISEEEKKAREEHYKIFSKILENRRL